MDDILRFEKVIEKRLSSDVILDEIIKTNEYNLEQCVLRHYNHILIDDTYQIDIECIIVFWLEHCSFEYFVLTLHLEGLFDSIATQNAEIRTVAKSLPLPLKNPAYSLLFRRLSP